MGIGGSKIFAVPAVEEAFGVTLGHLLGILDEAPEIGAASALRRLSALAGEESLWLHLPRRELAGLSQRRRHPDMLIDTCASGGHRNDLETLRRSVPLLRSDYIFEPVGQQCHTYGLAPWVPFYGTAVSSPAAYDPYTYRSNMCPSNTGCFDVRNKGLDYGLIRRLYAQWKRVAPNYFGDFYPLTPYSSKDEAWMAWQFHRPEAGEGMVQAFRRPGSGFFGLQLRLRGLKAEARYEVDDLDAPEGSAKAVYTGRELLEKGLEAAIRDRPGAALMVYREKQN